MDKTLHQFNRETEKIRRRLLEIETLSREDVSYTDQRVKNAESNVVSTVSEIYGVDSPEHREFRGFTILTGGMNRRPILQRGPNYERQAKFKSCLPNAIARLTNLVNRREEQLRDAMVCSSCDRLYYDTDNVYCLADGARLVSPSYDADADTLIRPTTQ